MTDEPRDDEVERAGEDSFPASDPPGGPAVLPPRRAEDDDALHEHGLSEDASTP